MPFNPSLPANNAPISSAELREQFSGLNDLISESADNANQALTNVASDLQAGIDNATAFMQGQLNTAIQEETAALPASVSPLELTISDPPTQEEVQNIANKLDELLHVLKRA